MADKKVAEVFYVFLYNIIDLINGIYKLINGI